MSKVRTQKTFKIALIVAFLYYLIRLAMRFNSPKFEKIIPYILKSEGGYVNDKDDSGGETKYGISKRAFPELDIKNLTEAEAKKIYYEKYYLKCGADSAGSLALSYQIFDHAINAGLGSSAKLLRVSGYDLEKFKAERVKFYQSIATGVKVKYLAGWLKRVNKIII